MKNKTYIYYFNTSSINKKNTFIKISHYQTDTHFKSKKNKVSIFPWASQGANYSQSSSFGSNPTPPPPICTLINK